MLPSERIKQIAQQRDGFGPQHQIMIKDILKFLDEYEQEQVDKFIELRKEIEENYEPLDMSCGCC